MVDCDNWLLLAITTAMAFFSELAFACFGAGSSTLYETTWQICVAFGLTSGSLESAVANTVILAIPSAAIQLFTLWEYRRWQLNTLCCIPYAILLPLGTLGLETFGASVHLKQVLGLLFLVIGSLQMWQRRQARANLDQGKADVFDLPELETLGASAVMAAVVAYASSGVMRGLFGVEGPPLMVLLMYFVVDRDVWRFQSAFLRILTILLQGGQLARHGDFQAACWPLYAALLFGGLSGFLVGKYGIASSLNPSSWQTWISLFLLSGAVLMLCAGSQILTYIASIGVVSVWLACGAASCLDVCRARAFNDSTKEALVIEMGWQPSASGMAVTGAPAQEPPVAG